MHGRSPAAAGGARRVDATAGAHALLEPGDRFALLVGEEIDRSTAGTVRLLSNQYLFPAIAVRDADDADVVVGVGEVPPVAGLDVVLGRDGAWVGRRP